MTRALLVLVSALAAAACSSESRIVCAGGEVYRSRDTIVSGDTVLVLSSVDSIRCEVAPAAELVLPPRDSTP
ncbi:MAG: hypothetical protein AB7N73_14945 [Gemmatimonadales bacterium]